MATDDRQVLVAGTAATPASFRIPGNGQVRPKVIFAHFDGSGVAATYQPALKITSDGGETVGIFPTEINVAAGGAADVSWFQGLAEGTSSSTPGSETLFMDSRESGGITSSLVLVSGSSYLVTARGTWSYVNHALDVGAPDANAIFPTSLAGRVSTQVGFDPETCFAEWSGNPVAGGIGHSSLFQMDLGSGFSHVEPSDGAHTTPTANRSYSYEVVGQGSAATFKFVDAPGQYSDNFGYVEITIQSLSPTDLPPTGPAGSIFRSVGGAATWVAQPSITEADLSLSNLTTDDVTTARHGFAPKAPNDASKFLDGTGAYSAPSGGSPSGAAGGSLAGTYPNPSIAASGVTAASYGTAGKVAQVTVGADGRVTSASEVTITAAGSSTPLAVVQYAPAALASYSITTNTLHALDTTNLTATFTVPASGNVLVWFGAVMSPATNHVLALGLLNHSGGAQLGFTYDTVLSGNSSAFADVAAMYKDVTFYLTGLTPGASLGIDIAASVVAGTAGIFAQGPTGGASDAKATPALIVVTAA